MRKLALALAIACAAALTIAAEMRYLIRTWTNSAPIVARKLGLAQTDPGPNREAIRAAMDRLMIDLPISIAENEPVRGPLEELTRVSRAGTSASPLARGRAAARGRCDCLDRT